jgi:hypothetical protein
MQVTRGDSPQNETRRNKAFKTMNSNLSFVQIDPRQNKIKTGDWQNEFDRPIYFIELRDSYACSWCELRGNQLTLVPYPHSRGQLRQVRYPFDAEVVGRVTGVTMCIAEPNRHGSIP